MDAVLGWCGLLGAWLLVAGPLYQGALELLEQDLSVERRLGPGLRVEPPPRPATWWWLVPPAMLLLRRRRAGRYRREVLALLTPTQRAQRWIFIQKAAGWFTVATGAALLAVEETRETAEQAEWSTVGFVALLALMAALCCGNTALLLRRRRAL